MKIAEHFGRDCDHDTWDGDRVYQVTQWFGPLGIGAEARTFSFRLWLPNFKWVWGYWR